MSLKLLLNTRMIWIIFIKTLKNTTQIKNVKYYSFLVIWLFIRLIIKKLNPIVTELFIRGRKINISLVFITQSYFAVPKNIRLNFTHYFVMKIPKKRELQQVAFNHYSDIDFEDFVNLYKKCTSKSFSFLVIQATLATDNSFRFRKNLV